MPQLVFGIYAIVPDEWCILVYIRCQSSNTAPNAQISSGFEDLISLFNNAADYWAESVKRFVSCQIVRIRRT